MRWETSVGTECQSDGSGRRFSRRSRSVEAMSAFFRPRNAAAPALVNAARSEVQDLRVAACPYCGVVLKKVPGAATRCPECHQTMYVRTDRRDQTRRVVSEEQADRIDDAHEALAAGDLAGYERRVRETTDRLRKKFGQEPAYRDVRWSMLNEDQLLQQSRRDYGLWRNTRWKMMGELDRSGPKRERQALEFALDIFYIDQCEPNNLGGLGDTRGLGIRAWGPAPEVVAGSLSEWIGSRCEKLGIEVEQAARDYEPAADRLKTALKMPRSWSAIWPRCL